MAIANGRFDEIRDAASKLLRGRSFASITTKELAKAANVSEATFFRYVDNKKLLLSSVYGDLMDEVLAKIDEEDARLVAELKGHPTFDFYIGRVLNLYRLRSRFYVDNPTNSAIYLRLGFDPSYENASRNIKQGDRTIAMVTEILKRGQVSGVINGKIEMRLCAQNLHGTYVHEIDRTEIRGFAPDSLWERLEPRLKVQLLPLEV